MLLEDDPVNIHQNTESVNSQQWLDAMNKEMQSMKDNVVWDLVPLLEFIKHIGNNQIFKTKNDTNGNVERFKAHLIVQGFTQKKGIDLQNDFFHRLFERLLEDYNGVGSSF